VTLVTDSRKGAGYSETGDQMTLNANLTVREIATENPAAIRVFESFGIDYCCGGRRSLEEACAAGSVALHTVLQSLAVASQTPAAEDAEKWADAALNALTAHIVEKHHGLVKRESPRLKDLLEKVRAAHGETHPELLLIQESFNAMADELRSHMFKEEQILFPYVQRLEVAMRQGGPALHAPFGTVANPIRTMMAEHDNAGELLKRIRSASRDFALPETACPTYVALYRGLEEFERDLHLHVHLENNILFPCAVELERKMGERHGL
jgi:regulator of cell morphogenesis and NO signaling